MNRLLSLHVACVAVLALAIPTLISAQIATCTNLTRTLSFGSTGTDVSALQTFLVTKGLLTEDSVSGFFGPLTQTAVQQFQCNQGLICAGSPSTTGWGVVGPKTRTAIKTLTCGNTLSTNISCKLAASDPIIYLGESTTLSWEVTGVKIGDQNISFSIDNNIGNRSFPSSTTVTPKQSTTYTGTVSYTGGVAKCQAPVSVIQDESSNGGTSFEQAATLFGWPAPFGPAPLTITFSVHGGITGTPYLLEFGDGSTGTLTSTGGNSSSLMHQYASAGNYNAKLSHKAPCSTGKTCSIQMIVDDTMQISAISGYGFGSPNTALTATPQSGTAPLTVVFSIPAGDEQSFRIEFGDGASTAMTVSNGGATRNATHTYSSAGTYLATVFNQTLNTVAATKTITVTTDDKLGSGGGGANSGATFNVSPMTGAAPLDVVFSTNVSGATVDFGDGTNAAVSSNCGFGLSPCSSDYKTNHTYQSAGTYTAKLRGTYCPQTGQSCSMQITTLATKTITVASSLTGSPNPGATFTATPMAGTAPLNVTFSTNKANTSINFGDGTSGTPVGTGGADKFLNGGSAPYVATHSYTSPGTFTAKLFDNLADCWLVANCAIGSVQISVAGQTAPTPPPPTTASAPSCVYKGTSYPQGHVLPLGTTQNAAVMNPKCDSGAWVYSDNNLNVCHGYGTNLANNWGPKSDFGCTGGEGYVAFAISPRAGNSPLSVNIADIKLFQAAGPVTTPYTFYWGDGQSVSGMSVYPAQSSMGYIPAMTHTYSAPGTYTLHLNVPLMTYTNFPQAGMVPDSYDKVYVH